MMFGKTCSIILVAGLVCALSLTVNAQLNPQLVEDWESGTIDPGRWVEATGPGGGPSVVEEPAGSGNFALMYNGGANYARIVRSIESFDRANTPAVEFDWWFDDLSTNIYTSVGTGFTSTTSIDSMAPESLTISIARCASR